MKILIVEDEMKTGEYLSKGLTEAGFIVDHADNGLNGYHLAMTAEYDLLILDIMLPDVNGWDIVRMLRSAEWIGGHIMPTGERLLSGYYLNELLLRMLARDDPHPALFDVYARALALMASDHAGEWLEAVLRAFELSLLREVGLLPALDVQTLTHQPLEAGRHYVLLAHSGLRLAQPEERRQALSSAHWLALEQAMQEVQPLQAVMQLCMAQRELAQGLKQQLRGVLHAHCGVELLRTRKMMMELQKL